MTIDAAAFCYACAQPNSGHVNANCRDCRIRDLARSPLFFECVKTQKLTPAYREALRALGGDETETHQAVKAAAKRHFVGASAA